MVGDANSCCSCRCSALSREAATRPVGRPSTTSAANEGPEKNAAGWCLRPSASGISSESINPVPTSSPFETETIGVVAGSAARSSGLSRNARECWTGTAWMQYWAPEIASAASVVARTLGGRRLG